MARKKVTLRQLQIVRITLWCLVCASVVLGVSLLFILKSKEVAYEAVQMHPQLLPLPIGVDPATQTITEQPNIDFYQKLLFASEYSNAKLSFLKRIQKKFLREGWYQNLASANTKILVIYAGQRKEEIIDSFGDILRWSVPERAAFEALVLGDQEVLSEGLFFPGSYVVDSDATPTYVATLLITRFNTNVTLRYAPEVAAQVPLQQALIVASLIEREAYTFADMRIISGVIWNRLFTDMKLQLDATLQYAKGSRNYEPEWWPQPLPEDKYIDSPYNTYQNTGLPPAPIANPSGTALLAALNPIASDCLFYFHDSSGDLYCSKNYEEHVTKLKRLYGSGR
tara:strand:- start:900 stop:1916 length:1017 start_codon:yes stop_codon:yes gene_type:complete